MKERMGISNNQKPLNVNIGASLATVGQIYPAGDYCRLKRDIKGGLPEVVAELIIG